MIVYLLEVCHVEDNIPRWITKEIYSTSDLAGQRLKDLKTDTLRDPENHRHLYRVSSRHVSTSLPTDMSMTQLIPVSSGTNSRGPG